MFLSEAEDKKQRCHLSNYSSVKKGETVFCEMKRNEELNYLKNGRNKITNPHLSLDVCFPPAILFSQSVSLLTNNNC